MIRVRLKYVTSLSTVGALPSCSWPTLTSETAFSNTVMISQKFTGGWLGGDEDEWFGAFGPPPWPPPPTARPPLLFPTAAPSMCCCCCCCCCWWLLLFLPGSALAHHVGEEFGEAEKGALCHQTQRLQHLLLHVQGVHPQGDAPLELTHVRINGSAVTDVIWRVRMRRTQNPLPNQKRLHSHLIRIWNYVLKLFQGLNFDGIFICGNWWCNNLLRADQLSVLVPLTATRSIWWGLANKSSISSWSYLSSIALFQSLYDPNMSLFLSTNVAPKSSKASILSCLVTRLSFAMRYSTMWMWPVTLAANKGVIPAIKRGQGWHSLIFHSARRIYHKRQHQSWRC